MRAPPIHTEHCPVLVLMAEIHTALAAGVAAALSVWVTPHGQALITCSSLHRALLRSPPLLLPQARPSPSSPSRQTSAIVFVMSQWIPTRGW